MAINEVDRYTKFYKKDIEAAISKSGVELGEGAYGKVYKGMIGREAVAIKMLKKSVVNGSDKHHQDEAHKRKQYGQEVSVLSKLSHENLVKLLGACPENGALVYEYLPGGTLEQRLTIERRALLRTPRSVNGKPPLTWQDRIRVAGELCAALTYLHTREPNCIVHGDLKPTNILFDANDVTKLIDFGICRVLPEPAVKDHLTTRVKGHDPYLDPLYSSSNNRLTPNMDIYAFGVVLLRLLTKLPERKIVREANKALLSDSFSDVLDGEANWPKDNNVVKELTNLALASCVLHWDDRATLPIISQTIERIKNQYVIGRPSR